MQRLCSPLHFCHCRTARKPRLVFALLRLVTPWFALSCWMARRQHHNDLIPFPTPNRSRDVYYPNVCRDYRSYPYDFRRRQRSPGANYDHCTPGEKHIALPRDRSLNHAGDLGWTLEYATAWCYKHLIGSQTEVADAIDRVRELGDVEQGTPFIIFDYLDRALFGGKLRGMVFLRWKSQISTSPGTTSAPGVVSGIPRICIELNKTPFEDDDGDIDDLLDALIHQMIHAFFLVACGAQPKSATQDGRLLDDLHFGVILHTIKDITRHCEDGVLDLIFYAASRAGYDYGCRNARRYIAIDPRGSAVGSAPADGQSHCNHDNRRIRPAEIKNWQVESYSIAIDLDMESKGDVIYDLGVDMDFSATDRLKGPPSSSYVELIWGDKRVMVPRDKALKYKSIKKPLEKDEKMELKVTECSLAVFSQVYNFITIGSTLKDADQVLVETAGRLGPRNVAKGPPVLIDHGASSSDSPVGVIVHLQAFKVAEAMKFEELEHHVLQRLWEMPTTTDDPIKVFKELYNDKESKGPIHSELHKWARAFLARTDDSRDGDWYERSRRNGSNDRYPGASNYGKLLEWYPEKATELIHRNMAFKEDCKLVVAEMCMENSMGRSNQAGSPWSGMSGMSSVGGLWTDPWSLPRSSPLSSLSPASSSSRFSGRSAWDDMALLSTASRPRKIDWFGASVPLGLPSSDVSYKYYGRDGHLKRKNLLTGEKFVRIPSPFTYERTGYSY